MTRIHILIIKKGPSWEIISTHSTRMKAISAGLQLLRNGKKAGSWSPSDATVFSHDGKINMRVDVYALDSDEIC